MTRIFHVMAAGDWQAQAEAKEIASDQFERHGFVHCCTREQLTEIASWWFTGEAPLVALEVDSTVLSHECRYEPSPTRWYPHVYGPLDAASIAAVHDLPAAAGGGFGLPDALASPPPSFRFTGRLGGNEAVVVWQAGELRGDRVLVDAAGAAVEAGRAVPVTGGVDLVASLATPYEAFSLLVFLSDEVVAYQGDGFFSR